MKLKALIVLAAFLSLVIINRPEFSLKLRMIIYALLVIPSLIASAVIFLYFTRIPVNQYTIMIAASKNLMVWNVALTIMFYGYMMTSYFYWDDSDSDSVKYKLCGLPVTITVDAFILALVEFHIVRLIFEVCPYLVLSNDFERYACPLYLSVPLLTAFIHFIMYNYDGRICENIDPEILFFKLDVNVKESNSNFRSFKLRKIYNVLLLVTQIVIFLYRQRKLLKLVAVKITSKFHTFQSRRISNNDLELEFVSKTDKPLSPKLMYESNGSPIKDIGNVNALERNELVLDPAKLEDIRPVSSTNVQSIQESHWLMKNKYKKAFTEFDALTLESKEVIVVTVKPAATDDPVASFDYTSNDSANQVTLDDKEPNSKANLDNKEFKVSNNQFKFKKIIAKKNKVSPNYSKNNIEKDNLNLHPEPKTQENTQTSQLGENKTDLRTSKFSDLTKFGLVTGLTVLMFLSQFISNDHFRISMKCTVVDCLLLTSSISAIMYSAKIRHFLQLRFNQILSQLGYY